MKTLLTLQYNGKNFFGWQSQPNKRTVQTELEIALFKLFKKNISIRGASRTDTGVSALCQLAVFDFDFNIPIKKLPFAINSFLPEDIVVINAIFVPKNFHPQYSVYKKTYQYKIYNNTFKNPLFYDYCEFVYKPLNLEKMQEACKYLIGEHDFKSFCASGCSASTTIRTIFDLSIYKNLDDIIIIEISGNGFLYNMVRIIAGTLINVGLEKYPPHYLSQILSQKNRALAGKTASAKGLVLHKIYYNI